MTCQNVADESGTGLRCARQCRSVILRWENFALRTASSSRRTSRLRPDGLSTLGIRDTGQNASQVQDAFRSLHYVAVMPCRPPLDPPLPQFTPLTLGTDPVLRGARPQKVCQKYLTFLTFLTIIVKMVRNENAMWNIIKLTLLRLKKVRFSRVKRGSAPGRTRCTYASCGISET